MPRRGGLRVFGNTGRRVSDLRDLFEAIDDVYNAIYVYELHLDYLARLGRRLPFIPEISGFPLLWDLRGRQFRDWPPQPEALRTFVPASDKLILNSAEFHSAGFWEFLGSVNPLEVIRKYINDTHERRKDREYRESAEKQKLEIENELARTELLRKQIELLKLTGATDQDLTPLRNALISDPLRRLDKFQYKGLIDNAVDPSDGSI